MVDRSVHCLLSDELIPTVASSQIDVHYSLPREDHGKGSGGGEKNQEMQGTLLVTLKDSVTGQGLDEGELRRRFQQFGDVKSIRPSGERIEYVRHGSHIVVYSFHLVNGILSSLTSEYVSLSLFIYVVLTTGIGC